MKHSEEYVTFKEFPNPNSALELIEVLKESSLDALFEEDSIDFDPFYTGNFQRKGFRVKLKKEDFEKADQLLTTLSATSIDNVEPGYYLLDFSQEELLEVISKKDEWNQFDFLLAQKLLTEKGIDLDKQKVELLKIERLKELHKGLKVVWYTLLLGYIIAFVGGFLGIMIGWYLWTHKKTLPNGDRIYTFQKEDRDWGVGMIFLGTLSIIFWLTIAITA